MRYGIDVHHFGEFADARTLAGLARDADEAGWDGFFIWDHVVMPWPDPVVDPWVALTAIAMSTRRIKFGPMVTPLARRRPWKVARETASLDQLSGGRLIFGVGLGVDNDYEQFGEPTDPRVRAAMLDEGLEVLTGLWSGRPFSFDGTHFKVQETTFLPTPVQSPRIPIWVAGYWPNKPPMRRAARWDGVFPILKDDESVSPEDLRDLLAYVKEHRESDGPFEVVCSGVTRGHDPAEDARVIVPLMQAGATWWFENTIPERFDPSRSAVEQMRERIFKGPPRL